MVFEYAPTLSGPGQYIRVEKKIRNYKIFVTASNFNTKVCLVLNSSLVELVSASIKTN